MAVVSDFIHIQGDGSVQIGDNNNETGWTKGFNTAGRHPNDLAYISFMIRGMTQTNDNAKVFVNDKEVGSLKNSKGGNRDHWQTQSVTMSGSDLNNGANTLRVEPVTSNSGGIGDFDDYFISNVICHYHQNV